MFFNLNPNYYLYNFLYNAFGFIFFIYYYKNKTIKIIYKYKSYINHIQIKDKNKNYCKNFIQY